MKEGNVIDVPSNSGPVSPPTETGGKRKNCGIKKIESVCVVYAEVGQKYPP